jgi:hypothetical protein
LVILAFALIGSFVYKGAFLPPKEWGNLALFHLKPSNLPTEFQPLP